MVEDECKARSTMLRVAGRKPAHTLATRAPKSSIIIYGFKTPAPQAENLSTDSSTIQRTEAEGEQEIGPLAAEASKTKALARARIYERTVLVKITWLAFHSCEDEK